MVANDTWEKHEIMPNIIKWYLALSHPSLNCHLPDGGWNRLAPTLTFFFTNHYNFIRQMLTSRYWNGRIAQIMLNIFTHPWSMKSLTQVQRQSSCRRIARQRWPAWRCCWHWLLQNSGIRQRDRWYHETNYKRLNKTRGLCGTDFGKAEEKERNGISWDKWKDKFWFWRLQAK